MYAACKLVRACGRDCCWSPPSLLLSLLIDWLIEWFISMLLVSRSMLVEENAAKVFHHYYYYYWLIDWFINWLVEWLIDSYAACKQNRACGRECCWSLKSLLLSLLIDWSLIDGYAACGKNAVKVFHQYIYYYWFIDWLIDWQYAACRQDRACGRECFWSLPSLLLLLLIDWLIDW
jgi:hypothetical protein